MAADYIYNLFGRKCYQIKDTKKKLVTITVVGAKGLKVRNWDASNVAPFFFYQFYTFDERYSSNAKGVNPNFNDT